MLPFMSWGVPSVPLYNLSAPGALCDSGNPTTNGNCGLKYNCQVITNDPSILTGAIPFYPAQDFYRCLEIWMNTNFVYQVLNPGFVLANGSTPGNLSLYFSAPNKLPFTRGDVICKALTATSDFVTLINQVDNVTQVYSSVLPAFAIGAPFDYYYQYVGLDQVIDSAVGYSLLICFVASCLVIFTVIGLRSDVSTKWTRKVAIASWAALIITAVVAMMVFEIYGFMGYAGIDISAIPAISIIMSAAVGVDISVPSLPRARGFSASRRRFDKCYWRSWTASRQRFAALCLSPPVRLCSS
jgi:hypothetical protein